MLKRLSKSIADAGRGIVYTFKNEQNFRIQIGCAIIVLILANYFSVRSWQLILLILLILLVLVMELLNTAVEKFADLLVPRLHHYIEVVKNIMAAAVLLTSIGAALIGIIIFYPHFIELLK